MTGKGVSVDLDQLVYPEEPDGGWTPERFNHFLVWASEILEVDDVELLPGEPMIVSRDGKMYRVTEGNVTGDDIKNLLEYVYESPNATAQVDGGQDLDFAYEINTDHIDEIDPDRLRFRVNATGTQRGWRSGVAVIFRTVPADPPRLEQFDIPEGILNNMRPKKGLVLVTGKSGSGKSTLLAAMNRDTLESERSHLVTYERPIEFDLTNIDDARGVVRQHEIGEGEDLETYQQAVRNSTRINPHYILVGEARDPETIRGLLTVAETGITAYSTVHTESVASTPTRMINEFPGDMRDQIQTSLLYNTRLIIHQRLVPSTNGGRVAVREFLPLQEDDRMDLIEQDLTDLPRRLNDYVKQNGQTLEDDLNEKYENGRIEQSVRDRHCETSRAARQSATDTNEGVGEFV